MSTDEAVLDLVEFWHTEDHGKALDDAARDLLNRYSLFDETVTVDGVVYDADRIRALVLERHQLATEINDLRARLKGAHTHLVQRTRALTRVISRERRQSAVVIGDTAYFPGRVREILEQYHRKGTA